MKALTPSFIMGTIYWSFLIALIFSSVCGFYCPYRLRFGDPSKAKQHIRPGCSSKVALDCFIIYEIGQEALLWRGYHYGAPHLNRSPLYRRVLRDTLCYRFNSDGENYYLRIAATITSITAILMQI